MVVLEDRVAENAIDKLDPITIHHLPCKIHYNGVANVRNMFASDVRDDHGVVKSAFRGRELAGRRLSLPEGCIGLVCALKNENTAQTEEEDECVGLDVQAVFDSICEWKHDAIPGRQDNVHLWMEWIELSAKLHEHV